MLKSGSELRRRDLYPNRRIAFQDAEPVKLITGIRRCGKSSLMKLMILHLRETGVADDRIIEMNFEFMDFRRITAEELYRYVKDQLPEKNRAYLFFDEIQRIDQWQDAVNSFRVVAEPAMYLTPAFQSMLPVRGAPGDSEGIYLDVYLFQSTLPARGATVRLLLPGPPGDNFNPRSPRGERRFVGTEDQWLASLFQSTLPMRGATQGVGGVWGLLLISIHAPREGSDSFVWLFRFRSSIFQSTLPVRGATGALASGIGALQFQSTLPVRGATTPFLSVLML